MNQDLQRNILFYRYLVHLIVYTKVLNKDNAVKKEQQLLRKRYSFSLVVGLYNFVFLPLNNAMRKDDMQKDEKRHKKRRPNENFKWLYFASSFCVEILSCRVEIGVCPSVFFVWRLFRLFSWRYFTANGQDEMAQTSHYSFP